MHIVRLGSSLSATLIIDLIQINGTSQILGEIGKSACSEHKSSNRPISETGQESAKGTTLDSSLTTGPHTIKVLFPSYPLLQANSLFYGSFYHRFRGPGFSLVAS